MLILKKIKSNSALIVAVMQMIMIGGIYYIYLCEAFKSSTCGNVFMQKV